MKAIQRLLLISFVPLLTQLTACSDDRDRTDPVSPNTGTNDSATQAGSWNDGVSSTGASNANDNSRRGSNHNAGSWRASEAIGTNVKDSAGDTIGDIDDIVVDMRSGEVIAVVISSGGFLGMGDTLSSVPLTALQHNGTNGTFTTNLTKEQLGNAPQFESNAWPDYNDSSTVDSMRSFRDSIGGNVSAPDNSAQNERELRGNGPTPMDQGNSDKDVQVTQDIRSDIMDTDLSFNAKNIKIITRDEHVTLTGVVESDTEHQEILKIAGKHATTARITDDLEVNSN